MAESYDKEVFHFKENFMTEAERLVLKEFPLIILKLNSLIQNSKFTKQNFNNLHKNRTNDLEPVLESEDSSEPSTKKPKINKETEKTKVLSYFCQSNKCVIDLIETIKPHIVKLIEDGKTIRMWICYLIPTMEVCSNFGVEIQEDTLELVKSVERSAANFYEKMRNYFTSRAKIVIDIARYPEVEDFQRAVIETDKEEYHEFCMVMSEIRNHYCVLRFYFEKS